MSSSNTFRFLHVSDVHLGCYHYRSHERQRDFFLAFESAIQRFALPLREGAPPQVDFVVIPGDLFDTRNIQPKTLSQASCVFDSLRQYNIPVFASEGNHDTAQHRHRGEPNWYNYLAGEKFLHYLQDEIKEGQVQFSPWDAEALSGGYYDFPNGVRIVGTQWYGTRADAMLDRVAEGLAALPPARFTILMYHGGLTDYVSASSGGADYERFLLLRKHVDYLALGHIHKKYVRQNWVFNPGSLEVTKISDFFEEHGVFRVKVTLDSEASEEEEERATDRCRHLVEAEHLTDFRRRPVVWLRLSCDLYNTPEELQGAILKLVSEEGVSKLEEEKRKYPADLEFVPPICYLELTGSLGFPFSEIKIDELEPEILETVEASIFRCQNKTTPRRLGEEGLCAEDGRIDRDLLERLVFERLISEDSRYKNASERLARWATGLKKEISRGELSDPDRSEYWGKLSKILSEMQAFVEEHQQEECKTDPVGENSTASETSGSETGSGGESSMEKDD